MEHQSRLAERLVLGPGLKVISAPPGFGKTSLLKAIAERKDQSANKQSIYLDRLVHKDDPRSAARILSEVLDKKRPDNFSVLIDDADHCEPDALVDMLDKLAKAKLRPLVILVLQHPDGLPLALLRCFV